MRRPGFKALIVGGILAVIAAGLVALINGGPNSLVTVQVLNDSGRPETIQVKCSGLGESCDYTEARPVSASASASTGCLAAYVEQGQPGLGAQSCGFGIGTGDLAAGQSMIVTVGPGERHPFRVLEADGQVAGCLRLPAHSGNFVSIGTSKVISCL